VCVFETEQTAQIASSTRLHSSDYREGFGGRLH